MKLRDLLVFACDYMGTDVVEVTSKKRYPELVKTRVIYANIAKAITQKTLGDIAALIGVDHATIIHYTQKKPSIVNEALIKKAIKAFKDKHGHEVEVLTDKELSVFDLNDKLYLRVFNERKRSLENLRIIKGDINQVNEKWVKVKLLPLIDEEISRLNSMLELRGPVPKEQSKPDGVLGTMCYEPRRGYNVQ
jgi:hypothetical protein